MEDELDKDSKGDEDIASKLVELQESRDGKKPGKLAQLEDMASGIFDMFSGSFLA